MDQSFKVLSALAERMRSGLEEAEPGLEMAMSLIASVCPRSKATILEFAVISPDPSAGFKDHKQSMRSLLAETKVDGEVHLSALIAALWATNW